MKDNLGRILEEEVQASKKNIDDLVTMDFPENGEVLSEATKTQKEMEDLMKKLSKLQSSYGQKNPKVALKAVDADKKRKLKQKQAKLARKKNRR